MKGRCNRPQTGDPLAPIVERVAIRSLVEFNIGPRKIQVPPPLPRRFPQLPMVERLQAELYVNAYCARIDGGGFDEEPDSDGVGSDMLGALSAANASRTMVDSGWMVLEIDPSGVLTVAKRGASRRISFAEVENPTQRQAAQQMQPPALGQVVSITIPRETVEQVGFYFAHGETADSTLEGRPALRIYWNTPAHLAPDIVARLTHSLNERGVPFSLKCPRHAAAYRRFDAVTLFLTKTWLAVAIQPIRDLHRAVRDRLRPDTPLFTRRLGPGLGFAEDPGGSESFGTSRCRLLAEGFWTAFVRGSGGREDVLEQIRSYFLLNGIDAERAYLNPWSIDRYNLELFA